MKKIMNKDNKGFSLIELIIVIAIMAVLIALIAPNLTKYLGSSKTTADKKNLDEIKAQVESCIADAVTKDIDVEEGTYTIKGDGTSKVSVTGGGSDFGALIADVLGKANTKSKVDSSNKAIEVKIEEDTKNAGTFTVEEVKFTTGS